MQIHLILHSFSPEKTVSLVRYFRYILRLRNVRSHKMQTTRHVARKRSRRKMSLVTVGTYVGYVG